MKKADLINVLRNDTPIHLDNIFSFEDSFFEPELEKPVKESIIEITEHRSKYVRKYNAYEIRTNFRSRDRIDITIQNSVLNNPISLSYQTGGSTQELVQRLMDRISNILTSNEGLDLTTSTFNINVIAMPHGAKPKGSKILNLAEAKQTKNSIVQIKNKDNLCCPRAVVVALTYPEEDPPINTVFSKEFSKNVITGTYICKGQKLQADLTTQLCNQLGYYNQEGFTLDDVKNLEKLINIQIILICTENFNSVIYIKARKKI